MNTMYKGEIQLTYKEYRAIRRGVNEKSEIPNINKKCVIKGKNGEIFKISCEIKESVYGVNLKLNLASKNNTLKKFDSFSETYSKAYILKSVKKISAQDEEENNIDFLINICQGYDRSLFNNKIEFYINQLDTLGGLMDIGDKSILENEISYRNFENEIDLALATCSILFNIYNLNENIQKLYLDKLYYVGIEIEDYYKIGDLQSFDERIGNINNKEEALAYMLNLIYLIINNKVDRKKDKEFICNKAEFLMYRYIRLYDFN